MTILSSVLEEKKAKEQKVALTLPKGIQRAILTHRDKYFLRIPSTPVPHLFKTNGIPSDEDRAKMRAYIRRLQRIVVSTETSPFSIERYRGNRAYKTATRHVQLLQITIRDLPPEIIQRVVYFTLSPPYIRKECSPWVASWVCSSWRRTVLGHPHLWGNLPEISLYLTVVQPERKTELLQELLRRSGDAPLSVSIHFLGDPNRDRYKDILLDLLLEQSHRFADVRFNLNPIFFSSLIMPALSRWRRLRHLSLRISGHDICPEGVRLDLRLSTSLRSIDVPGSFWSQVLLPPHLETPTLYSTSSLGLALEDFVLTRGSPTRNLASSATKLVLPAFVQGRPPGEDLSPVFAPRVTEIVLYDSSPHHSRWATRLMMLDGFVTPCLHTLKISFVSSLTLTNLAPRSSDATSLTTLHLLCPTELLPHHTPRDVGISMDTLTALLESTPNVVNFKIFDDTSSYSFIHLLANFKEPRKDRDSYPLPRLQHLTIFVRWDIRPRVLDLLHYVAISRMERPPPYGKNHFSRLETLEVVLNRADNYTQPRPQGSPSTVEKFGTGRPIAPHAAQDRVRGIMEGWLHSKGLVGPASHFPLVAAAEDMRDVQRRLAKLSQSGVDEVPLEVFKDVERCLESLVDGLGSDDSLSFEPIETIYLSGVYWNLRDLKNVLESGSGWRMPGFSMLHHTSVELATRILVDWEPRLTELTSRTRWFNLGEDSLIFLRLDDPRRLERETRNCLVNGFPLLGNGSQRSDLVLPPLLYWTIGIES